MISSVKAKEIGLINDFVEAEKLTKTVMELAVKIASKPSSTVTTGKKAFYEQAEMSLSRAYEYTSEVMKNNLLRDDAKEGISAFINKRSPDWQDD
jgi:enoyl-CoA hydratase/carnithine racemase